MVRGMRKLASGCLVAVLVGALGAAGCYGGFGVRGHARGPNLFSLAATAITVAAISVALSNPPPMAVEVEYDPYARPGNVWVNGHYAYLDGEWVWQPGYWQPERVGYVWVQGSWAQQGDQYVWVDGAWVAQRAGYVYIDGYWDYRDTGYVWLPGRWESERPGYVFVDGGWSSYNGRRVWAQGSWQRDDGRASWSRYRARSGSTVVRDHRR